MSEINYQEVKVQWISKRGERVLIWSAIVSILLGTCIFLAEVLPMVMDSSAILFYKSDKGIVVLFIVSFFAVLIFIVSGLTMKLIVSKTFNEQWRLFLGIWYCIFGFVILGVLILKEPVLPKEKIAFDNPEILPSYRDGYVFIRTNESDDFSEFKNVGDNDETYWIPKNLRYAMMVSFWISLIYLIAGTIGLMWLIIQDFGDWDTSIAFFVIAPLSGMIVLLTPFCILLFWKSFKNGWIKKRNKSFLIMASLLTANVVSFILMLVYKLGYNTDDYYEVRVEELSTI